MPQLGVNKSFSLSPGYTMVTLAAGVPTHAATKIKLYFKNDPTGALTQEHTLTGPNSRTFTGITNNPPAVSNALDRVENLGPNTVDYTMS